MRNARSCPDFETARATQVGLFTAKVTYEPVEQGLASQDAILVPDRRTVSP